MADNPSLSQPIRGSRSSYPSRCNCAGCQSRSPPEVETEAHFANGAPELATGREPPQGQSVGIPLRKSHDLSAKGSSERAASPPHSSAGGPMCRTGTVFSYPSAQWQSEASDGNESLLTRLGSYCSFVGSFVEIEKPVQHARSFCVRGDFGSSFSLINTARASRMRLSR